MKKFSRRKMIQTMGLTFGSLFVTQYIGCDFKDKNPVFPDTENSIENAKKIVDLYCKSNLSGNFLNSFSNAGKINKQGNEAAWDFIAIVKSYKIIEAVKKDDFINVKVEYDYVGKCRGPYFYAYKNKMNSNKLVFNYKVVNNNICVKQSPILEINTFKNHISTLINRYNKILEKPKNSFWNTHATSCISKYQELLFSLK